MGVNNCVQSWSILVQFGSNGGAVWEYFRTAWEYFSAILYIVIWWCNVGVNNLAQSWSILVQFASLGVIWWCSVGVF